MLLTALASACSGSSSSDDAPSGPEGPLYAINTRVYGGDFENPISYISLVDDLESGSVPLSGLPLVVDSDARITVFDAEPSFERSPLDNVWPRRLPRNE